jgi:hypothetical protein
MPAMIARAGLLAVAVFAALLAVGGRWVRSGAPGAAACRLHQGEALSFAVRALVTTETTPAAARRQRLAGRLHWRVLHELAPARRWRVAAWLQEAQGPRRAPVLLSIDDRCQMDDLAAGEPGPVDGATVQLLQAAELVGPAAGEEHWQLRQRDDRGTYDAVYERPAGDPPWIYRTGRRYLGPAAGGLPPEVTSEDAAGRLDAGGAWFDLVRIKERVRLPAGGELQLRLALTAIAPPGPAERSDPFWTERFDRLQVRRPEVEPAAAAAPEQMVAELERRLIRGAGADAVMALLVPWLRGSLTAPAALVERIRGGRLTASAQAHAFLALQEAGGQPAHGALVAAAADQRLVQEPRLQATVALGRVIDPDAAVIEALRGLRDAPASDAALRATAEVSLGALAGDPRLDQGERRRLVDELASDLAPSRPTDALAAALLAAASSHDAALAPAVEVLTGHGDPAVASNAYHALVALDRVPPAPALIAAHERARVPAVRAAIEEALAARLAGPAGVTTSWMVEQLTDASDPSLRALLIRGLRARAGQDPDARVALASPRPPP